MATGYGYFLLMKTRRADVPHDAMQVRE